LLGPIQDQGRGLASALCTKLLQVARDHGATQAIAGPRGDKVYPVPRRLYMGLAMRPVAHFIPMSTS
jgi:GNAT superfamily N-acetyltransferase